MAIKVGDKVIVIAGSNKGKEGTVKKVLREENRVIVEGVNIVKRHQKGNGQNDGGIVEREAPIHVSNVSVIKEEAKKTAKKSTKSSKKVGEENE